MRGGRNSDLSTSPTVAPRYVAEMAKARYLHAGERQLLKDYTLYK
jgi:hypothetical protein